MVHISSTSFRSAKARAMIDGYSRYMHASPLPSPQLLVFGRIGPDEKTNNKHIKHLLTGYPNAKTVDVLINSSGGFAEEAHKIFNTLQASGLHVTCRVLGVCASAATIILLAGSHRLATNDSQFILHDVELRPDADERWTARRHLSVAQLAAKYDRELVKFYSLRTGLAPKLFEDEMKRERMLDATAALKLGLIHGSIEPREAVVERPGPRSAGGPPDWMPADLLQRMATAPRP